MSDAIVDCIVTKLVSQELKTEYRGNMSRYSLGGLFDKHCMSTREASRCIYQEVYNIIRQVI